MTPPSPNRRVRPASSRRDGRRTSQPSRCDEVEHVFSRYGWLLVARTSTRWHRRHRRAADLWRSPCRAGSVSDTPPGSGAKSCRCSSDFWKGNADDPAGGEDLPGARSHGHEEGHQEPQGLHVEKWHLFVFANRRRDRLKILVWDRDGYWVLFKRLEAGTFRWPKETEKATVVLPSRELMLILEGVDLRRVTYRKRYVRQGEGASWSGALRQTGAA